MPLKVKIGFVLMTCLHLCETAFARAGGGGSHSSSHKGGGYSGGSYYYYGHHHYGASRPPTLTELIVVLCISALILFLMFRGFRILILARRQRTNKKLDHASKKDSFWNKEKMIQLVHDVYPQIQAAWTQRELKTVSHLVSLHFIQKYQPLLNSYKLRKIINVLDCIKIDTVSIIKIIDDTDNNKDQFRAYIKGEMRDYFANEKGFAQLTQANSATDQFEDIFIFIRKDQTWLLDDIINDPSSFEL